MMIKSITYAGKDDVFNLEVEGTHNYAIENGAIVHNCRYFCMSRPIKPRVTKQPKETASMDPLNMFNNDKKYGRFDFYSR